ncbi:porin [Hydrogenophaga sp. MI9]|uniref:porin n=1 Tax=Hydrogenophaga sp. MI9 TaxID=3453719 RepID=UPI003EED8DBC
MQKNIIVAALALCGAGAAMAQTAPASKVELWGIVDAAVRHTNNEGVNQKSKTQMIGGGMSQSRWGINVTEDLGGGNTALVVLENRLNADDGSVSTPFFQLANVGLQTPYGRLTAGRQWNVLFDVVTSTYASFPYSPYMEAYKPELGFAMGARTSNMLKYTFATPNRSLVGSLQYSFDENNDTKALEAGLPASAAQVPAFVASTLGGGAWKTFGGYLRYAPGNGLAVGGGYLRSTLPGGTDVDAWTLGGSYRTGPWYLSAGYGLNKAKFTAAGANPIQAFRNVVDGAILGQFWAGQSNGGYIPGDADKRQLFKLGVGYQATPQLNVGLHYFHGKQTGSATGLSNGKANFVVAVADYAFSKRTDAYVGIDNTRLSGGDNVYLDAASKARSRTGFTIGLRHRF